MRGARDGAFSGAPQPPCVRIPVEISRDAQCYRYAGRRNPLGPVPGTKVPDGQEREHNQSGHGDLHVAEAVDPWQEAREILA